MLYLLEVVREVSVEVESPGVVSALSAVALAFPGDLEAVGVHGGQDVDAGVVEQPLDVRVRGVAIDQILRKHTPRSSLR